MAPSPPDAPEVTEDDWERARRRVVRRKWTMMCVATVLMPALGVPALALADATSDGAPRWVLVWGWLFVLLAPFIYLVLRISVSQQHQTDAMVATLTHQLTDALDRAEAQTARQAGQVHRQEFERRLANALDMAEGEAEVVDVIERSLRVTLPTSSSELLLADNSHAHLLRMASASPTGEAPCCSVDSPDQCPAARRAQVQHFADSEELDACPKLRGRPAGAVSAVCVPVSIMGRTVGVIHSTGAVGERLADDSVADLATLANLAGARIGLLRVMAETQLQASTDALTGLLNRRSFEHEATALRSRTVEVSVAMVDLDHFKELNDTYGHETGDRALRLFAQQLRESVREQDVVGRHGGEEFVVALGGCPPEKAAELFDRLRARLDAAITVAGAPRFTASFGVVGATRGEELPKVLARADAALLAAKRSGRNRVVVGAPQTATDVEPDSGTEPGSDTGAEPVPGV
ncbi:MAG TPA: sensor domain-containing diguanylate cyclase [Acidimicrobiales bacterium]|nr:sensor domain-containing diguanylate cyclase [Acidimicrobiales bacterium]